MSTTFFSNLSCHDTATADANLDRTRLNTVLQMFLGYFHLDTFVYMAPFYVCLPPSSWHQSHHLHSPKASSIFQDSP